MSKKAENFKSLVKGNPVGSIVTAINMLQSSTRKELMDEYKVSSYVCSECGSPNIQVQAWVNANTNEYVDDITDNAECWCEDCGKHTKLKEV